jgi:hypothetical protein
VFHRLYNRLKAFAAKRLHSGLRPKVDASDIVTSAYRAFHEGVREGRFRADGWRDLWQLLVTITKRKCNYQIALYNTEKRNLAREQSLQPNPKDSGTGWLPLDSEASPADIAATAEDLDWIAQQVPDWYMHAWFMAVDGYKQEDIAKEVGRAVKSVQRAKNKIELLLLKRGWTAEESRE